MPQRGETRENTPPVRALSARESPDLIYFSSVSENTRRFVERVGREAARIPVRPRVEGRIRVARPFVLIQPTYGGGSPSGAVPRQVAAFLNDPQNRALLRGVITAGNTNFGEAYCLSGRVIAQKCRVPELYRFELLGTHRDRVRVAEGLDEFWASLPKSALETPIAEPSHETQGAA